MTLVLLFSSNADAQVGPEGGDWALQFQITNDFTLDDIQGSIVSVKYHSSQHDAWRAGLGLDFDSQTSEREETDTGVPLPGRSSENSQQAIRLDLQYLRYANPDAKHQFLFGGGPFAGFDNRPAESYVDGGSRSRMESDRWLAGVSGLVGVEWFVASSSEESWNFGARDVLLGVSAHF